MRDKPLHILFSGGVTGGHLFPGLAVAEQLLAQSSNVRITFAGAGRALDRQQVFQAGHEYQGIPCHATPRRLSEIAPFLRNNRKGIQKAMQFIQENDVHLVVGLGGYASVPTARAATRCNIPLVLLEQNVCPGRATRWLARSANMILPAFTETEQHLRKRRNVHVIGNPVRSLFLQPPTQSSASSDRKHLLILGGSNGAGQLNQEVPKALYRCRKQLAGWDITHQSGTSQHADTQLLYRKFDLPVNVVPFLEDMAGTLAHTDLAISRAGGTTLSELAVSRVPVILCPLTGATNDHQRRNAEHFADHDAAVVIPQLRKDTRFDIALEEKLLPLITDAAKRTSLATGMARMARPQAAARAAELILHLLRPTRVIPAPLGSSVRPLDPSVGKSAELSL